MCQLFQCRGENQSRIRLERACERGALLFYRRQLEKAVVMDGIGGDMAQAFEEDESSVQTSCGCSVPALFEQWQAALWRQ